MIDWAKVERVLDDRSVAHDCAFCGAAMAAGSTATVSFAVRQADRINVLWAHRECFPSRRAPQIRSGLEMPLIPSSRNRENG